MPAVQATVRNFSMATGDGDVLLDDGRALPFSGDVFAASGLRLLRSGQRVRIQTTGDTRDAEGTPTITALTLATF